MAAQGNQAKIEPPGALLKMQKPLFVDFGYQNLERKSERKTACPNAMVKQMLVPSSVLPQLARRRCPISLLVASWIGGERIMQWRLLG